MKNMTRNNEQEMNTEDNQLHELFLDELTDILNAERQLTKALPKMAKASNSEELTEAFESHLAETENHITRLEQVFTSLGEMVRSKKCNAMEGLLEEGQEKIDELEGSPALDAALIAAAQKVEHYEIASYGTLCAWAEQLGHDDVIQLLQATLDEEKTADVKLTGIAQSTANSNAE